MDYEQIGYERRGLAVMHHPDREAGEAPATPGLRRN
jgi:hypothetical protein